jgi:O-acetyl-ADP-ribose deacetylase (regulator of RNase III)
MIHFQKSDVLKADVDAQVNTVNCVGVMGRGIALQFKKAFPDNFKAYEAACKRKEVQIGKMFVFQTGRLSPRFIINFPTKDHWKGKSKLEYIEKGISSLAHEISSRGIRSIAIPPLGCGLGGLNWSQVRPIIENGLKHLTGVEIYIYEPGNTPAASEMAKIDKVPDLNLNRASMLALIKHYLSGLMDPFVTVLEVQKLLYFMQSAGQNELKLKYEKATYGPYAPNLSFVLTKLEGHFITGYGDGGDDPEKLLELIGDSGDRSLALIHEDSEVQRRFDRVADLIEGFETPAGMELLATVHWVVTKEGASNVEEAVKKTHSWGNKKVKFSPEQIKIAYDVLVSKNWLN